MPTPHNYYEILEVQPDADLILIKSQYRKLVRLNHPDIASDKDTAHERMQLILEAYNVLADAEKRAAYDLARQNRSAPVEKAPTPAPSGNQRLTPRSSARPVASRSYGSATYGGRMGAGRASASRSQSSSSEGTGSSTTRTRLLTLVFDAANLYFEDGRAQEAISICERVMKADASNAEAPALLGDIYADQGRTDLALMNYERAVRRQPHNLLYRQKWEDLKQTTAPGYKPNGTGARKGDASGGGCAGRFFLWVCLIAFAATPFLLFYFGEQ